MRTIRSIFLFFLAAAAAHAATPEELLAQVDAQRTVPNLSFVMTITSMDGEKALDYNTLWGYVQGVGSANRSLLSFVDPASVKGRKMLMDGNIVYLLFPRTTNPIRLSPLQVLTGQASNGDVVRTAFAADYDVASLTDATRDGVDCWQFSLALKPSRKDSYYARVGLWVEKATLHPVYAEFFSGDRMLKKAVYRDFRAAMGKQIPFLVDITDADSPNKHTTMAFVSVSQKSLPDTAFRRDYLPSWMPEQPR